MSGFGELPGPGYMGSGGEESFAIPKRPSPTENASKRARKEDTDAVVEPPADEPVFEKLYEAPTWGAPLQHPLRIEVLKGGVIIDVIQVPAGTRYLTCGRLPSCDIEMEHSSISRYHAVLQFSQGTGASLAAQPR